MTTDSTTARGRFAQRLCTILATALALALGLGLLLAPPRAAAADSGGYPYAGYQGPRSNPASYTWTDASGRELSPYGYSYRNCTDFVAWKLDKANGFRVAASYGNAKTWGERNARITNTTPAPGAVAWSNAGRWGHVAWVESVNGNVITVQDYNKAGTGQYSRRTANRSEFTGFIHFKDLAGGQGGVAGGGRMMGALDEARRVPGGVAVSGWSIDTDTRNSIDTHVYGGDGTPRPGANPGVPLVANQSRPDVARAHPAYGAAHGFSGLLGTDRAGRHTVCAYGINAAGTPGGNDRVACRDVVVSNMPYGHLDVVEPRRGGVRAAGWSIDPDSGASIDVHLYGGDGGPRPGVNPGLPLTANVSRTDVADAYPGYGARHGFDTFFALPAGRHTVCAYGINAGGTPGTNPRIDCRTVDVPR